MSNKTKQISCRMTEAEYSQFCSEVAKTYLSNSEFMRRKLLLPPRQICDRKDTDWKNFAVLSLSQMNNNINQIARVMNAIKHNDAVVIGSVTMRQLAQVEQVLQEWNTFEFKFRKTVIEK